MIKLHYLDKHGCPVKVVEGQWFRNFLRKLIYTRKIVSRKIFKMVRVKTALTDYWTLVRRLGDMPARDVVGLCQECRDYHNGTLGNVKVECVSDLQIITKAAYAAHPGSVPNKLTLETLEKSERGEDVQSVDTVEELFEDLDKEDD